jgi:propionate CoA-transferase
VRTKQDVENIHRAVDHLCSSLTKKAPVVVNYDDFQIDESVMDDYAQMVEAVTNKYYTKVSRYTTSAFMRLKLGEALENRGLSPYIYETRQEALNNVK